MDSKYVLEGLCMAISIVVFLGNAFFLKRLWKTTFSIAAPSIILIHILILFLFGLSELLLIGFYFVIACDSIIALLFFISRKNWHEIFVQFRDLDVWVWLIFALSAYLYTRGTLFYSWDEFSHWGLIYKTLMFTDRLPGKASSVFSLSYPPATVLFQYLIGKILNFDSRHLESNAYLAQMILVGTFLLSLFPRLSWRKIIYQFFLIAVAYLLIILFDFDLQTLYVDLVLGILFAAGLARLIGPYDLNDRSNFYLLLIISSTLPLIKPLGLFFSLSLIALSFILDLIPRNNDEVLFSSTRLFFYLKNLSKIKYILLICLPLLMNTLWSIHIKPFSDRNLWDISYSLMDTKSINEGDLATNIEELIRIDSGMGRNYYFYHIPTQKNISMESVFRIFSQNAPYRTKIIVASFINTHFTDEFHNSQFSLLKIYFVIFGVIYIILRWGIKENRTKIYWVYIINIGLFLLYLIYIFLILLAYIYYFGNFEATYTPELLRYLSPFLLGWLLLLVAFLERNLDQNRKEEWREEQKILILLLLSCFVLVLPVHTYIHSPKQIDNYRLNVQNIFNEVNMDSIPPGSKVYQIWQNEYTNGYEFHIMRYLLCPLQSNAGGFQLSLNYDSERKWAISIPPSEWIEMINSEGYSHVFIGYADEDFWDTYGYLFDRYEKDGPQLFTVHMNSLVKLK